MYRKTELLTFEADVLGVYLDEFKRPKAICDKSVDPQPILFGALDFRCTHAQKPTLHVETSFSDILEARRFPRLWPASEAFRLRDGSIKLTSLIIEGQSDDMALLVMSRRLSDLGHPCDFLC